jgi:hypothetical protein
VAVAFDTLTYARRLREVGVPQEQAEAHAEALAAAVTETLATKEDLRALATKQDLHELAVATKRDLHELAVATKRDLHELELRLTLRLGGMVGVSVAAVAALVRLM